MNLRWRISVLKSRLFHSAYIFTHAPLVFNNWLYFLGSRFTNNPGILRLRNGLRFKIRPKTSDRAMISEMFILKTYEDEALGYQINPGDTILDVGANIGSFSLLAAHKQAGQIFAIEPAKEVFELLQENIRLNGRKNISLFNLALDAGEGVRELQLGDAQASFHWKSPFGAVQMVPTLSLGMFLERNHVARVDFLKMDCEGSEFDVLFNSDRAVLRKIHRFAIEFHNLSPEKNADTLKEDLEAKGFSIDLCRGEWNGLILARNKNFEPDMMPEPRAAGSL